MAFSSAVQDVPSASASINITPLVDVMLVLLIIFMVTMPMTAAPLQAALPQHSYETTNNSPALQLSVQSNGEYLLDGQRLTSTALRIELSRIAINEPRRALRISAAESAEYQSLVLALDISRQAGLSQIAMQAH